MSDARWALIEPMLSQWRAARGGLAISDPKHELREIVNAIAYLDRTGIGWEYMPHDVPPAKTVYYHFARWRDDGTIEHIHDALREQVREAAGRKAQPTAAILHAQSVKTSSNVPESSQGIDAGKKNQRPQTATSPSTPSPLLLVVLVTAASVQDSAGGISVIKRLAQSYPTVIKAWVDAGFERGVVEQGAADGIDVQVVTKTPR